MIKLKKILNEANGHHSSDIAYHIAELEVRNSIKKYGLDPNKYKLTDRTTHGNYIYVFLDYDEALGYARIYNDFLRYQEESQKEFDVWQVNVKGLKLIKDFTLNTGDDPRKDSAYITHSPIDKKRLKLIKTIE